MECAKCGKNFENANYCPECGTPARFTCPKCGTVHSVKFCPSCGQPPHELLRPSVPQQPPPHTLQGGYPPPSGYPYPPMQPRVMPPRCPRCGSPNVNVQAVAEVKRRGCLTILLYLFLICLPIVGWIALAMLLRGNKSKTKTYHVCQNCGAKW